MKWVTRWLISHARLDGTVLDLGCGEGEVSIALAQKGLSVTAVDHDSSAIIRGKEAAQSAGVSDRINWLDADIEALNVLPAEAYRTVILGLVLHHLSNRQEALRQVWRLVEPEGRLLIAEMLPRGPKAFDSCHSTPLGEWLSLFLDLNPDGFLVRAQPGDEHVVAILTKPGAAAVQSESPNDAESGFVRVSSW